MPGILGKLFSYDLLKQQGSAEAKKKKKPGTPVPVNTEEANEMARQKLLQEAMKKRQAPKSKGK